MKVQPPEHLKRNFLVARVEELAVKGFRQVPTVDEIRIRWSPPKKRPPGPYVVGQDDGYPLVKIYLMFSLFTPDDLQMAENIETEFNQRLFHEHVDVEVIRLGAGEEPTDSASSVWHRKALTP